MILAIDLALPAHCIVTQMSTVLADMGTPRMELAAEATSVPSFKSPVALHVEALTESMRTLHTLKNGPVTPQCEKMIETVTRLQENNAKPSADGALVFASTYSVMAINLACSWQPTCPQEPQIPSRPGLATMYERSHRLQSHLIAVTASILRWLQENELEDIRNRQRAYTAVCRLWTQAQEKAREAAWFASRLPGPQEEDISEVEAKDNAYSEMISSLVRACAFMLRHRQGCVRAHAVAVQAQNT
jgi:hypothetical protein